MVVVSENRNYTPAFIAMYVGLVIVVVGVCYTLTRLKSARASLEAQEADLRREMAAQNEQLRASISGLEATNTQQLDALRGELDQTAKRLGSKAGGELSRARLMLAKLQQAQQQQAEELKREIAKKADVEKVGALTQDVSSTRSDLGTTRRTVDTLSKDLGMARSELGNLVARNHDEIETLRKLGDRDYFEFTLRKNEQRDVAGISLVLKKTNPKRSSYNLNLVASDQEIQNKNHNIDQPIFFYVGGLTKPYELVINQVGSSTVKGYLSTPKGVVREASSETGRAS